MVVTAKNQLGELISHLRDLINNTRKQYALLQERSKWNMLCSSLDAIEDTRSAIKAYSEEDESSNVGMNYLRLYGLLQALVLQQDAITHASNALDIEFTLNPRLKVIREIRNDSIGHPTRRDRRKGTPECYCMIVQITVCKWNFEYHRHTPTPDGTSFDFHEVNLKEVIQDQESLVYEAIERVCNILEEEENKHRMEHKDDKLADTFPQATGYYFEKISDSIHHKEFFGLGKMHVDLIVEIVEKFKTALEARGLWNNSDGVQYHYNNITYPLEQLDVFFEDREGSKLNDRDAEIFRTYIGHELDALREIAKEIDEGYEVPVTRKEPEDDIGRFISYFQRELNFVSKKQSSTHQRILLSCLLDTIAHARFPDRSNKDKITGFLGECCQWSDADRVSLPQLMLALKRKNLEKGKLYLRAHEETSKWEKGDVIVPSSDLKIAELSLIAVEGEKKFLKEKTYLELFYNYRNHLVHAFRKPGHGMDFGSDSPYYHSMSTLTEPDIHKWQLVYPVGFFIQLCRDGLIGLEKYLRDNNVNPYDLYPFGDEWTKH